MKIVYTIAEVERAAGGHGFIPTMGALHAGHETLLRNARERCDFVTLSIFVNPLQFGPNEDLSRYPRSLDSDLQMAERAGVDQVFVPTVEEMVLHDTTRVVVPKITERWEGAARPGHFDGVATIVAKLFGIIGPQRAYFGRKDLQQCLVVRKMVRDLSLPVEIVEVETLRESDGLAMSSRNVYLSPEDRAKAPLLFASMERVAAAIRAGDTPDETLDEEEDRLSKSGFVVDYLAYVAGNTMVPLTVYSPASTVIAAAKLGTTRLIDNLAL